MGDQQGQNDNTSHNQSGNSGNNNGGGGGQRFGPDDVKALARDILNSQRAEERISKLLDDNYNYREQRRNQQNDNGATATQLAAYQALGSVDDLKKALTDGKDAMDKLAKFEKQKALADIAAAAGANVDVLQLVAGDLEFEIETVNNQKIVMVVDAGGKKTPIADYAASNWPSLKSVLFTSSQGDQANDTDPDDNDDLDLDLEDSDDDDQADQYNQRDRNNSGRSHGQGRNLSLVRQSSGHSGSKKDSDSLDDYIDQLTAPPKGSNPLMPASQRKQ